MNDIGKVKHLMWRLLKNVIHVMVFFFEIMTHAIWTCAATKGVWKCAELAKYYKQFRYAKIAEFFSYALDVIGDDPLEALGNITSWVWHARRAVVFEDQQQPSELVFQWVDLHAKDFTELFCTTCLASHMSC